MGLGCREFCPTGHAIQPFASGRQAQGPPRPHQPHQGVQRFRGKISPWQLNISCFVEPLRVFGLDPWSQVTGLWVSEPRQNPSLDLPAFRGVLSPKYVPGPFKDLEFAIQGGEVSGTHEEGLLGWGVSATICVLSAWCPTGPSCSGLGPQT